MITIISAKNSAEPRTHRPSNIMLIIIQWFRNLFFGISFDTIYKSHTLQKPNKKIDNNSASPTKKTSRASCARTKRQSVQEGQPSGPEIMQELAGNLCTKLGIKLFKGLKFKFSDKCNALYGLEDMYLSLLSVCCREGGGASIDSQYQRSKHLKSVQKLPSRNWILNKIKNERPDYMLKRCKKMITRSVLVSRRRGMFRDPIDVSIDMHDIPFYCKVLNMTYAIFSKSKRGTTKFNRLATIHCVVDGCRFTLGIEIMRKENTTADMVKKLISKCKKYGIRISSVTLDREFHSVEIINLLKKMNMPVLMPAVKTYSVKKAIKEFDCTKREAISAHTIKSTSKYVATYTLVIIKKPDTENNSENDIPVIDKYYVFATTMDKLCTDGDAQRVADFYRKRWGIENAYKSYEQMRPRTTSTSYAVRILLWFLPFLFYNLWMLARFKAARTNPSINGRPPVTLNLFASMLLDEARHLCYNQKPPD